MKSVTRFDQRSIFTFAWLTALSFMLTALPPAWANDATASPATTTSSTRPAATAATDSGDAVEVKRGTLELRIDSDGVFEPINPFEARVATKSYQGDLTIVRRVDPDARVAKGDVLLEIDPEPLKRQLLAAENELTIAMANLAKARADVEQGAKQDALAMTRQRDGLATAQQQIKWWEDNDVKAIMGQIETQKKVADMYVENSQDELDQLKKMYKSEDLTSETADIVMKRAIRTLDIYKVMRSVSEAMSKKLKELNIAITRRNLGYEAEQQTQSLAQLETAQKQAEILRQTSLMAAQLAVSAAQLKVDDLKKDLEQFTIRAPADGIAVYGSFNQNVWQETPRKTLAPGERIAPRQVVMTVISPAKLRARMDLPESKLFWIKQGMPATVRPVVASDLAYDGTIAAPPSMGSRVQNASGQPDQNFAVTIDLPVNQIDPRVLPGYRANIHVDAGKLENALLVPVGAVGRGSRVWIKKEDGTEEARDVVIGKSDGKQVEIKSGLREDEKVLKTAKT